MSGTHARGNERAYEPVADIARGGMGRVELVVRREGSFARVYAMKRLRSELAHDREVREMFLEEARIAGLIRHPNVVPVLDVGEDENGPYLVMDYVEGVPAYKPLLAAVEAGRRLPLGFCVEVARQAAHGLAAAHELEGAGARQVCVVHRDVSPHNILIGFDGLVRVTDFGVARALDRAGDDGIVIGKVGYMSPEQTTAGPVDARSDLFSFGVVLYELVACRRLYAGQREKAFDRIREEPPPDLRAVRDDVPHELAQLVLELLAKSRHDRPPSARIVAARLEDILSTLRDGGEDVTVGAVLRMQFGEEQKRQRALVAAALERTVADISLLDSGDSEMTTTGESHETVRSQPTGQALMPPPAAERSETMIAPRGKGRAGLLAIGGAVLALLVIAIVIAIAATGGDEDTADTASAPACVPEACRAASGAGFFCNAATGLCESVISPVCPALSPAEAARERDTIVLGTIFDRSQANQLARERAARLAVDGLNRAGGIDGRRVMLVHCDSAIAGATAAADRLVQAGVPAIIGPSTSAEAEAVFSEHAHDGVLVISPSATATQLAAVDPTRPGLLWRTAPPDSLQATVMMHEVRSTPDARSVVVVRRSSDVYAQSLSVILQEAASAHGLAVQPSQVFADTAAIERVAEAAARLSPDVVFFLSTRVADAAAFLDATSRLSGYDGTTFYFGDAAANDGLVSLTTTGSRRFAQVRATRPAAPSTIITSELVSEYASANGGEDPLQFSFTAHAYDATALVLLGAGYAVAGGGALTGERIARGIALTSSGTREHRLLGANFPATIAALRAPHPDVDVVGTSGPLDYDPATEEITSATYEVLGIRGRPPHLEVLETVDAPPPD